MSVDLLSAFCASVILSTVIAVMAWWLRQPGTEAAGRAAGAPEPVCRLHDWHWTESIGYVCRRCRRLAG